MSETVSALVVMVPEADSVVGRWRERWDPAAGEGVPAHVSVLYPFLDGGSIDDGVAGELSGLLGAHEPFEVRFAGTARWPGVLYLPPEPDGPLRALTAAAVSRWPQVPPYGGRFGADPQPHLTVGIRQPDAVYDEAEREITARLPIRCRVSEVLLTVRERDRWAVRAAFPLGAGVTAAEGGSPSPTAGARGGPSGG